MPKLSFFLAMSGGTPDIAKKLFKKFRYIFIGIFSPLGEKISLHRLRCSPFAVYKYSFMGLRLADAAIFARE